jgi:hypothetical protein
MKYRKTFATIGKVLLILAVLIAFAYSFIDRPDIAAAPLEQQTMTQPWFDHTIPTGGTTAIVDSGAAGTWAAFLHVDAPGSADSITMTIGGRAIVGTTIYTSDETSTLSIHEFSTAQNKVISDTYSGGKMWPQHYVTVNSRNASLTGDLLWIQK